MTLKQKVKECYKSGWSIPRIAKVYLLREDTVKSMLTEHMV